MHKFTYFFLFLLLTNALIVNAQADVIINQPEHIKSIVLRPLQSNNYTPIIKLGERFILEFDDLNGNQEEYTYKIEHYDYNWQPSGLIATEYINGYSSDWIRDYEDSLILFNHILTIIYRYLMIIHKLN